MGSMKEDELLTALTAASRQAGGLADPRWDRLAEGTLTPDEARELAAVAEESEVGRTAHQAFQPLDEDFRERMTDVLLADLARGAAPAAPEPARDVRRNDAPAAAAPRPVPSSEPSASRPKKPAPTRTWAWVGALAAAAALALFLSRGGESGNGGALPAYGLTVIGGEKPTRADPTTPEEQPLVLGPGSRLELVARPATPARGTVHASTYMQRAGGPPVAWAPPIAVSEGGAARIVGTKEQLFPTQQDGEWELVIVLGREALALPRAADCATCAVLRRRIRLHSQAP